MMDTGNLGHIVHRNDCVGKEKAFVKDIGTGYITFEVDAPTPSANGIAASARGALGAVVPDKQQIC